MEYTNVMAVAMLTQTIAQNPDHAEAYLQRGQMLLGMGDAMAASKDAEWLLQHVGESEEVLLLKARTEAAMGQIDAAVATYTKLIKLNPLCVDAFRERGRVRFSVGNKEGAKADMQKVLELEPDSLSDVSGNFSTGR